MNEQSELKVDVDIVVEGPELLRWMQAAHQQDITFNQFVNNALKHWLEENKEYNNGN